MTDLELNQSLTKHLCIYYCTSQELVFVIKTRKGNKEIFDFSNWGDLMPLVIKHQITIEYQNSTEWFRAIKSIKGGWAKVYNENAQRALAECLLKVLESENE